MSHPNRHTTKAQFLGYCLPTDESITMPDTELARSLAVLLAAKHGGRWERKEVTRLPKEEQNVWLDQAIVVIYYNQGATADIYRDMVAQALD